MQAMSSAMRIKAAAAMQAAPGSAHLRKPGAGCSVVACALKPAQHRRQLKQAQQQRTHERLAAALVEIVEARLQLDGGAEVVRSLCMGWPPGKAPKLAHVLVSITMAALSSSTASAWVGHRAWNQGSIAAGKRE